MRGIEILRKTFISSWFLACIPAVLFIIILPPLGSRYKLSIDPPKKVQFQRVYADLNSDSISEIIEEGKGVPYFFLSITNNDHKFFDQWNLADTMDPKISGIFTGDYDHDRYKEIYVFTHRGDSLFLNVNEILQPSGTRLGRIFITKIGLMKGEVSSLLYPAEFFDENGDGKDELYFSIYSYFNSGPRRIFMVNLKSFEVKTSPKTSIIYTAPEMADVDEDRRPEIIGTMSASGNFRSDEPYSDSSTWFMVFDDQLKFKFPPEEFPGFVNSLCIRPFKNPDFSGYVLLHFTAGADPSLIKPRVGIYSPDGKLIRYSLLSELGFGNDPVYSFVFNHENTARIYLIGNKIISLNDRLEVEGSTEKPLFPDDYPFIYDLNNDGEKELLIYSGENKILKVYDGGLRKLAEQPLPFSVNDWRIFDYYSKDYQHKTYIESEGTGILMNLKKNKFYYLSYSVYPGIYLLFVLFILLIRRINTFQVVQKEELKQRLLTLQLQGIKSQLDPHFTFNTLNSVASLIYTEEKEAAYDYMNKFTQLLRGMINDAEKIYRPLADEIEFVNTYLDLEKLRFGEKFTYRLEVGPGVTKKELVPKLVLQTFAENSIKHGILPKDSGGELKIRIAREADYLKITIEDNGIGRTNSTGLSRSTGKGLKITGEFYEILNQINNRPIHHEIKDLLSENGEPAGTLVEVWVPVDE